MVRQGVGTAMAIAAGLLFAVELSAEEIQLRVVGWNVESGDSSPATIAQRIANEEAVDIWGLSEVPDADTARQYETAAEVGENADFQTIVGTTGDRDRLVVLYNANRLKRIAVEELHSMNIGGRVRAPLVVTFEGRTTGKRFLFMVNHLYRSRATRRHEQARKLNQWARNQPLPVIAVGDYNFDWHYQSGDRDRDRGYDLLTEGGVFTWVRPDRLIPTNASGHQSVLDFVFVCGDAAGWTFESTILEEEGDFPDDDRKSDHRPVDAIFRLETTSPEPPMTGDEERAVTKAELLDRIRHLESEIADLRRLVERLE